MFRCDGLGFVHGEEPKNIRLLRVDHAQTTDEMVAIAVRSELGG